MDKPAGGKILKSFSSDGNLPVFYGSYALHRTGPPSSLHFTRYEGQILGQGLFVRGQSKLEIIKKIAELYLTICAYILRIDCFPNNEEICILCKDRLCIQFPFSLIYPITVKHIHLHIYVHIGYPLKISKSTKL